MKPFKTKLLVAGLLAGSLAFVGCKSDDSAERASEDERVKDAESESEPGVHQGSDVEPGPGVGGSGLEDEMDSDMDEEPNVGGNINEDLRAPNMPAEIGPIPEEDMSTPEDTR